MDNKGETSELQQLVSSDAENEDSIVQEDTITDGKIVSPGRSNKISSSGNTSHSSVNRSLHRGHTGFGSGNTRIQYVNEKKATKEAPKPTFVLVTIVFVFSFVWFISVILHEVDPSTAAKHHSFLSQVPDVRLMERALLGLLDDFQSGKLKAFGSGCTMEQMTSIREQQEKLAKLHFDLGVAAIPSLNEDSLQRQKNNMSQLIQRLEQLSASIEGLHNNTKK